MDDVLGRCDELGQNGYRGASGRTQPPTDLTPANETEQTTPTTTTRKKPRPQRDTALELD